jgi:excisionase family DNA binding protein
VNLCSFLSEEFDRISHVEKRFLEECLAKGMSLEAIGGLAGKHPSTVSYWLHKFGLQAHGARGHRPKKSGLARDELEPLVEKGLTIEEIARQLGVGDTTTRNWLRRHGLRTQGSRRRAALASMRRTGENETELECRRHGMTRHVATASESRLRCAKCRSEAVSRRRRKVKEILVDEAGGRCTLCGYERHSSALQFHHLDPSAKSFGLGVRGITRSIDKLREEAAKCVLLCANCHAEVEAGVAELPVKSRESMPVRRESD